MASLRALLLLAAVSAACAATLPAGIHLEIQSARTELVSHIRQIEAQGALPDVVEKAIKKLEELAAKIKERVLEAEDELVDLLESSTEAAAKKLNDLIKKITKGKVDLKLDEKWEEFEKKTANCDATLKAQLKEVLESIKSEAETCSADQLDGAKEIAKELVELLTLIEDVPVKAIKSIKDCNKESDDTPADTTADTPADTTADTPADTTADTPADTTADTPVVNLQGKKSVSSLSGLWKKTKCVLGKLWTATEAMEPVPKLVYELIKKVDELASKKKLQALETCIKGSLAGKEAELQTAAAKAAYCIIAPTQQ